MKNLVILIISLNVTVGLSQKIDYNNFDNKLATIILKESFLRFRDTINSFGNGEKWSKKHPEVELYSELNKPRWSDWLYETISLPNSYELINDNNLDPYHVDRSKWFKDNRDIIRVEYYKGVKDLPKIILENAMLGYSENAVSLDYQVDTYEQLAKIMIDSWEKSIYHRCAQRGLSYDVISYEDFGLKIQNLFSCSVLYNSKTGLTKAVINFIEG